MGKWGLGSGSEGVLRTFVVSGLGKPVRRKFLDGVLFLLDLINMALNWSIGLVE